MKRILIASIILTVSCGFADDLEVNFETGKEQELVFVEPTGSNEFQNSIKILKALSGNDKITAGILWKDYVQSRSTAQVKNFDKEDLPISGGSAKMASASLLFTADHVIDNILKDPTNSGKIFFKNDYIVDPVNISQKDDLIMRLRLKSLGLDPWVDNSIPIELIRFHFEEWPYVVLKGYNSTHKQDVAILKTQQKTIDTSTINFDGIVFLQHLPSWQVLGPGMFFDYISPRCIGKCLNYPDFQIVDGDSLSTHHFNLHMDTSWMNNWIFPGTAGALPLDFEDLRERIVNNSSNLNKQRVLSSNYVVPTQLYNDLFSAQIDMKQGSSGGAVIVKTFKEADQLMERDWIGIISLKFTKTGSAEEPADQQENQDKVYSIVKDVDQQTPNPRASVVGVAKILDIHIEDLNKNIGNLAKPFISSCKTPTLCYDQCINTNPNIIACLGMLQEEFSSFLSYINSNEEPKPNQEGCLGEGCGPDQTPPATRSNSVTISCRDNSEIGLALYKGIGMGLGVLGSPSSGDISMCNRRSMIDEQSSSDFYLGSVGLVCGPFSYKEWSMNWDYIKTGYVSKLHDCVIEEGEHVYTTIFNHPMSFINNYIGKAYLYLEALNSQGVTTVLPAPIQMCPPGYIMRGLQVKHVPGNGIKGIHGLYCIDVRKSVQDSIAECGKSQSPNKDYPCYIPTNLSKNGALAVSINSQHSTYENSSGGEYVPYPAVIRLGDVYDNTNLENFICREGLFVSGIKVSDTDEITRWIDITCIQYK